MPSDADSFHIIIPAAGMGRRMGSSQQGPKSLIEIAGKSILMHTLSTLERRGARRLSLVVGYQRERFMEHLGTHLGQLTIEYIVAEDYATTEHGWSLYQARNSWQQERQPVLFMDADNVFAPGLLDHLLQAPDDNLVLIDPGLSAIEQDEELVLGENGRIAAFARGHTQDFPNCVGGFVGMNRFSPAYMERLFAHMEDLFAQRGRMFKYERVFDDLLQRQGVGPNYLDIGEHRWINVNQQENLEIAKSILLGL